MLNCQCLGRRSPAAEEHRAYASVLDLIRRGVIPVERLLTHQWPLAQAEAAFAAVAIGDVLKGMLVMP